MVSRSARHRLATLTSWALAVLVVAVAISIFVALTGPKALEAVGLRSVPPTLTPVAALVPTPTPAPLPTPSEPVWAGRAAEVETLLERARADRRKNVQDVIDFAASDIESWSSDAVASVAVVLFDDEGLPFEDRLVGVEPNLVAPSASLAKAYWVTVAATATLDESREPDERLLAVVEERASAIFTWSSNDAATALISQVGVDEINSSTEALGMSETFLTQWASGQRASETNPFGPGNTTSTSDAVRFLDALRSTRQSDAADPIAPLVLDWMLLAPDDMASGSYGGVFTDRLPEPVRPVVAHKAGWLPPACCKSEGNTLNAMGLVDLTLLPSADLIPAGAASYALAVSVTNGRSYDEHAAFIAWTSCLVYQTLVDSSHGCGAAQDAPLEEPA